MIPCEFHAGLMSFYRFLVLIVFNMVWATLSSTIRFLGGKRRR